MSKRLHEVRDAVHVFVEFDEDERLIIDSPAFQRLRHVHQLALTYKVYPGATHKRFEHSLGVMHLAGRIYDVITRPDKISDSVRVAVPSPTQNDYGYWRTVVRMAALCHDMGHLPFSHAAEDELLPEGVDHELLTWKIVHSGPMAEIFNGITPPVRPDDVGKLAVGPRQAERLKLGVSFTPWEAILAEVIVGDSFGADRMDYLLRDSLHTGVQYGRFDHERLINTLRIMREPAREKDETNEEATEPVLGCERGGLQSAEQLLLARYFMFSQVYHHPTRLAYNEHLKDFLKLWLPKGVFPIDVDGHLSSDDADVLMAIKRAARNPDDPAHDSARRIVTRDHFKVAYEKKAGPQGGESEDGEPQGDTSADVQALARAAQQEFGEDLVAYGAPPSRKKPPDFAVWVREEHYKSKWASGLSDVFYKLPESPDEYVLADGGIRDEVRSWLETKRDGILTEARATQIKEAEEEVKT
ncbi:MAG: HD domain-containing protein [Solirubrobacteraceae bacterium]